jgi:hypothetical protein
MHPMTFFSFWYPGKHLKGQYFLYWRKKPHRKGNHSDQQQMRSSDAGFYFWTNHKGQMKNFRIAK